MTYQVYIITNMQQSDRFFQPSFTSLKNFESLPQDPTPRLRQSFLTQRYLDAQILQQTQQSHQLQQQHQSNLAEIQNHHSKLNNYIDNLGEKVHQLIDTNEAEIVCAYKNHVSLVKKQMQELRIKTLLQANSSSGHMERIQQLEKQLCIFREEALILFRKIVEKDRVVEELKMKADELMGEKKYMDQSIKALAKRNKQLQAQLTDKPLNTVRHEEDYTQKFDLSLIHGTLFKPKSYRNKPRTTLTSANISKTITQNPYTNTRKSNPYTNKEDLSMAFPTQQELFNRKLRIRLNYLQPQILNSVISSAEEVFVQLQKKNIISANRERNQGRDKQTIQRATRISMRSKSNCTVEHYDQLRPGTAIFASKGKQSKQSIQPKKVEQFRKNQEMSDYFVNCIETVKKEFIKRKKVNSINFYKQGNPVSYSEFKKADWFRLMELLLTNEHVIQALYNILVPFKS